MTDLSIFELEGEKAVVTGGYTGIGRQMAEALLEAGADVAVCARRIERWKESYDELARVADNNHRILRGFRCDVSSEKEVEAFFNSVLGYFGSIDVLVNAAGIAWSAPALEMKLEDWEKVIRTNLTGTFLCSRTAARSMISRKKGSIINVSSVLGLFGSSPETLDAVGYTASKAGIIGLTKDLALKLAMYNIRVNAVAPGWFRTHMTDKLLEINGNRLLSQIPMGRFGSKDDLKGVTVFLASKASSYITGQVICVDGGLSSGR
ncbi:MAG: 3-oxoacyl-ACP reductase FabG [Conexivisphaerales archaeon]